MQTNPPVPRLLRFALATATFLCTLPLVAQNQGLPDTVEIPTYTEHLTAVVVSSLDGRPVPRVLVTSSDGHMSALTDSEGRFSFDVRRPGTQTSAHVFSSWPPDPAAPPAPTLQFEVRKPGYIAGDVSVRIPPAQAGDAEPTLQLRIVPGAVLTGHLDPDAGDLPAGAFAQLAQKVVADGTAIWGYRRASVNSRGEFRFADLAPGDYKLLAPAYVDQPAPGDASPDSVQGFRASYYPNSTSFDSAEVIHIGPGESSSANLTYRSAPFYRVTVPIAGLPADKGFYANLLPEVQGLNINHDQKNHLASGYLPSGDYTLALRTAELITPQNQFPLASVASVHLQVSNRALRTEPAALHPALEIPVDVRHEFTGERKNQQPDPRNNQRSPPEVWVGFHPVDPSGLPPIAQNTQGVTTVRNVSEGTFHVEVTSSMGGYVASVTSGTTDLLREPLRVVAGVPPRPIEVTLRDDSATINARLAPAPDMLPQAANDRPVYILCLALDRPEAQSINFAVQYDRFPMPNLAPGRYLLLASHRQLAQGTQTIQPIEFHNPDVVRDLIPKGIVVTLSAGQTADVEIPMMPSQEGN